MKIPFQQLSDINGPMAEELKGAAASVIDSGWYLRGPQTEAFEKELAMLTGSKEAIATSNGLDSLRLIFRALMEMGRLKKGDKVIVPANTFIASVLPLSELGLIPVLIDPDEATMNLDFKRLPEIVAEKDAKAVLVVHLYGSPCWDESVAAKLREKGILIIEDNAQGIGARVADGRRTGSLGDAAAFSFYPAKNIGALGDSGAVTTSDSQLAECIRQLANYGSHHHYYNLYQGYNNRMDEIQAAMLRVKLKYLEEVSAHRRKIASIYNDEINNPLIIKPLIMSNGEQVWHQYVVCCDRRDELQQWLADRGIGTMVHYPVPPHLQPCYENLQHEPLPIAERLAKRVLSLPIAAVKPDEAREISKEINRFL